MTDVLDGRRSPQLKAAIEAFDASSELRTCRQCGYVQPERPEVPQLSSYAGS